MRTDSDLRPLLRIVDQAYDHRSWHGTTLRGSLRRVSAAQAIWRPAPARHNIWEVVIHAAYWKYAVQRRVSGGVRGSFPLKGSNWFPRTGKASDAAWRADIALLDDTHRALRAAIQQLAEVDDGLFFLISGIAAHDLYHAGQIQLLKKLAPRRSRRGSATKPRRAG